MAEGMFGSNIKPGSAPRSHPFLTPGRKPQAPHVSLPTAPHVSISGPRVASASVSAPRSTSSSSIGSFHAVTYKSLFGADQASSGGGSGLDSAIHGVEGFFGHLGSDVVRTAMGIPVGVAYLVQHPIAGAEQMVSATWHDWSPLFHGQYGTFAHNFYEHPLAPILDIATVLTLGGAGVARGAALAGRVGEAVDATSAASDAVTQAGKAATAAARTGSAFPKAMDVAEAAGKAGTKESAVTWWQGAKRFANPVKYSEQTYRDMGRSLGYTDQTLHDFVDHALTNDPFARVSNVSKAGVRFAVKDVNKNPALRVRDSFVRKGADKVGEALPKNARDSMLAPGEAGRYTRWNRIDRGSRKAAVNNLLVREFKVLHDQGKILSGMSDHERAGWLHLGMRKGIVAHSMEVKAASDVAAQAKHLGAEGKQFITSDAAYNAQVRTALAEIKAGKRTADDFVAKDWAKMTTTDDPKLALTDANGNFRVVSAGSNASKAIATETFFSNKVVKLMYTNPTKVWRYLILGASPRYFVNNFVGNTAMLIAGTDPVNLTRAFHDYVTIIRGAKEADRTVTAVGRHIERAARGRHVLEEWLGQEYGFGQANRVDPVTGKLEGKTKLQRLPSLHGVTHTYADMPQRYMAALYTLRRMPIFQSTYAELRAGGKSYAQALDGAVERSMSSNAVRMQVREQMHHMLGQYHTFTAGESLIRRAVPFYAWDRAIASHMKHLITQEPYKVAMGAALGSLGNVKTQEIMGQVPDFMLSAIPAKLLSGPLGLMGQLIGKNSTGRVGVLNAMSLSPYGSIGDETNALMAAAGMGHLKAGDSLGTMLNPIIQGAAAQIAGVDLTTGTPVKPGAGGPIVGTYLKAFGTLPQINLAKALMGMEGSSTTSKGNPTLYEKNLQAQVSSFLGLPMRQVNLATANAMAALEHPDKVPPKKHHWNKTFPGL